MNATRGMCREITLLRPQRLHRVDPRRPAPAVSGARPARGCARPPSRGRPPPPSVAHARDCNVTAMIARVWRGVTPRAKANEYHLYLQRTGVKDCEATPGNRGVYVLRREEGDESEFLFISLWDSLDVIRGF